MKRRATLVLLLVLLAAAGLGLQRTMRAYQDILARNVGPKRPSAAGAAGAAGAGRRTPATDGSNILPEDYVGPATCEPCHTEIYASWQRHPHSRMNQNPSARAVQGDFGGARVAMPGGEVVFASGPGGYTMRLERGGALVRSYAVTRTVGSRFSQFYIGRQIEGPEPKTDPLYTVEHKLPYAYWLRLGRWLPEHYFDPFGPDAEAGGKLRHDAFDRPELLPYNENCMLCHNTYAYVYRLGMAAPRQGFPLEDLRFSGEAVFDAIGGHVDLAGLSPKGRFASRLSPEEHLVVLGVSCESCHFGGRDHAVKGADAAKAPEGKLVATSAGDASWKNPRLVTSICRQCHSATATVLYPNGAGAGNSREALDLLAGGCASAIKCTDCHDPHTSVGAEAQPDAAPHLAACAKCHAKLASAEGRAAHVGYPAHAGKVSCLDCHMPRVAQGIDTAVRSHFISSPTDTRMLAAGSVNACNLCHLDKPIGWTLDALAARWGKRVTPEAAWAEAYGGDLTAPVGKTWLRSSHTGVRMAAAQAYGRSPLGKEALGDVLRALEDPVAVNRVLAASAVERITGTPLGLDAFDPTAPQEARARQIAALLARLP